MGQCAFFTFTFGDFCVCISCTCISPSGVRKEKLSNGAVTLETNCFTNFADFITRLLPGGGLQDLKNFQTFVRCFLLYSC